MGFGPEEYWRGTGGIEHVSFDNASLGGNFAAASIELAVPRDGHATVNTIDAWEIAGGQPVATSNSIERGPLNGVRSTRRVLSNGHDRLYLETSANLQRATAAASRNR